MTDKNELYKWDTPSNIPCGNIDIHTKLCYTLLHVKHDFVPTLNIPDEAAAIIEDCQAPLLDIINDLQERIQELEE